MTEQRPGGSSGEPAHRHRDLAESFGAIALDYDRARPRYPAAQVEAVAARLPGRRLLDVGIGTGISSEPFRDRGFDVLGLEPDPHMAKLARAKGLTVEIGRFEDWDAHGRTFDGIISGQTWHWIEPEAGAARAASVLCPGGLLALFWNVGSPPRELAERFARIFSSLETGIPFNPWAREPDADPYGTIIRAAQSGLEGTGEFTPVERLEFRWQAKATRDAWLATTATSGGINRLPDQTLDRLLTAMGREIDATGGGLLVDYTTVAAIATRRAR